MSNKWAVANTVVASVATAVVMITHVSCGNNERKEFTPVPFPMVRIPSIMSDDSLVPVGKDGDEEGGATDIIEYKLAHYWDEFMENSQNLPCDTNLVNGVQMEDVEQAFVNYLLILQSVALEKAKKSMSDLYDMAESVERKDSSSNVFETLTKFAAKYLYNPNSPLRYEDLYLPFVSKLSKCKFVSQEEQMAYAHLTKLCSLNCVGTVAADFGFSDKNGRSYTMHEIKADYTLIFFSNPGCQSCKEIMDALSENPSISELTESGKLAVLNIYIDSDVAEWHKYVSQYPAEWYNGYDPNLIIRSDVIYNVRAIPSLYLLDKDKKVIMKDATRENVFSFLANIAG